jgi:hypothetical protein
MLCEVAG